MKLIPILVWIASAASFAFPPLLGPASAAEPAGAATLAPPAATPAPTPVPSQHLRARADPPVYLCAGVAGEAVAHGDSAKTVLGALEYTFTYQYGARVVFDPEGADGDCPYERDRAIVEVVYARIRTRDDNYVIYERHFEGVDVGVVVRAPDGTIIAQVPAAFTPNAPGSHPFPGAVGGAWVSTGKSQNQIALLGATSVVLIANAKNTDQTAAAATSFLSSFSALKFPVYHQSDAQYQTLRDAAQYVVCHLIAQLAAAEPATAPERRVIPRTPDKCSSDRGASP